MAGVSSVPMRSLLLALAAAMLLLGLAQGAVSPVASRLQAAAAPDSASLALDAAPLSEQSELDPSAELTLPLALDAQVEVEPSFNASQEETEMAPPPAYMLLRQADENGVASDEGVESGANMLGAVSACAQRGGTCQSTSQGCAGGSFTSGLCPGAANIKCCLVASSACSARGGSCRHTSVGCPGGAFSSGLCPGNAEIKCCLSGGGGGGSCGVYSGASVLKIVGNNNQVFGVVRIAREHLTNPAIAGADPSTQDNTMTQATACAFQAMYNAASRAGVRLTINSGFRTYARQQYFWNCYVTKKCNNGNLAARPGTSNHGIGLALDINTGGGAYNWLKNNAHSFGFIRTVPSETWHWEYRPGQPPAPYT